MVACDSRKACVPVAQAHNHIVLGWNDKYGNGPPLLRPETCAFWASRFGVDEDADPEAFLPGFEEKVIRNGQSPEG